MFALVYVSTATELMAEEEVQALLTQSRDKNARLDITGVLLYHDGSFMQVLEGDAATVRDLYAAIRLDRRHYDVTTIVEQEQPARLFVGWTMAFRNMRNPALRAVPGYETFAQLLDRTVTPTGQVPFSLRLLHMFVQQSR